MGTSEIFHATFDEHLKVAHETAKLLEKDFSSLAAACAEAVAGGGKLIFFGNGGSAADAQHIAAELSVRFVKDRPAIAALALTTDTSVLTAAANDMGYAHVFERQVEALGRRGDLAIGISTSGKSPNVVLALAAARKQGLVTAALTGAEPNAMKDVADHLICVPSKTTARIQEMHIVIGHMLCAGIEKHLGYV
ncbi:D-sedoheptulose 7-phosphate isomerase [Parvibaculum sp.]|uniref:D-sedoheptulose 7-phosphate isomerase n=1 Tax=Parvibaculum sp. TaxID=2024848 RepID=UPI001E097D5C|nr:D-sedoheptulose 7-phosphate isomerase [Parvibaculum sp.]MBX3489234.1 D-sedoheptulose 7-phosphate isomerase [Parvibaculum sp.]MCW5726905.1 D-sedoheptulose 7-phosphate isomerase [Parvibaculum sp.]